MSKSKHPFRTRASALSAVTLTVALSSFPAMAQNNSGDPMKTPVIFFSSPPVVGFDRYEWTFQVQDYAGSSPPWYWAQQNSFQNSGGIFYWGLQPHSNGPAALFSFFGAETHSSYVHCASGADGGSGVSCFIRYPWVKGRSYKFTATLEGEYPSRSKQVWSGTITDPSTGVVTVIGVVAAPRAWGLIRPGNMAWAEWYLNSEKTCAQRTYFRTLYDAPIGYLNGVAYPETITGTNPNTCATYTPVSSTQMLMEAGGTR